MPAILSIYRFLCALHSTAYVCNFMENPLFSFNQQLYKGTLTPTQTHAQVEWMESDDTYVCCGWVWVVLVFGINAICIPFTHSINGCIVILLCSFVTSHHNQRSCNFGFRFVHLTVTVAAATRQNSLRCDCESKYFFLSQYFVSYFFSLFNSTPLLFTI